MHGYTSYISEQCIGLDIDLRADFSEKFASYAAADINLSTSLPMMCWLKTHYHLYAGPLPIRNNSSIPNHNYAVKVEP